MAFFLGMRCIKPRILPGLFLLLFPLTAVTATVKNPKPSVISGYDDVLRQAENTGLWNSAIKILEKDKTYAGMPELYRVLTNQETSPNKFILLSAIATWFDTRIEIFLTHSNFPKSEFRLRNWLTEWGIQDFKRKNIDELIALYPTRNWIVIFDNSAPSLKIATELSIRHPTKIAPIYLRETLRRGQPGNYVSFITAFDIAWSEFKLGRMTLEETEKIGNAVVAEKVDQNIIPEYSFCPVDYNPCSEQSICKTVGDRIQSLCRARAGI